MITLRFNLFSKRCLLNHFSGARYNQIITFIVRLVRQMVVGQHRLVRHAELCDYLHELGAADVLPTARSKGF